MIEQINVNKILAVNVAKVWAAISNIDGLEQWFPIISSCSVSGDGVGAIRTLNLTEGGIMKDRIEEIDHQAKRFRYLRIESPFPVKSYRGTVELGNIDDNTCQLSWLVEIDIEEDQKQQFLELIRNALVDGINGLDRDLQTSRIA